MKTQNKQSKQPKSIVTINKSLTPKHVATWVELLVKIAGQAGGGNKPLTPVARRRLAKMRKGGHDISRRLAVVAQKRGLDQIVSVETMLGKLDYVDKVRPLADVAQQLAQLLGDQVLLAENDAWKIATTIYTTAQRLGVDDPNIAQEIAQITGWFKTKRAGKNAGTGSPPVEAPATDASTVNGVNAANGASPKMVAVKVSGEPLA